MSQQVEGCSEKEAEVEVQVLVLKRALFSGCQGKAVGLPEVGLCLKGVEVKKKVTKVRLQQQLISLGYQQALNHHSQLVKRKQQEF